MNESPEDLECPICGTRFKRQSNKKYCSRGCCYEGQLIHKRLITRSIEKLPSEQEVSELREKFEAWLATRPPIDCKETHVFRRHKEACGACGGRLTKPTSHRGFCGERCYRNAAVSRSVSRRSMALMRWAGFPQPQPKRLCVLCQGSFDPGSNRARYCSRSCANMAIGQMKHEHRTVKASR